MRLAIIIPALNESANIVATLMPLQVMRTRGVTVTLVDGGSHDDTMQLAAPLCDGIVESQPGRSIQMNAGAGHVRATSEAYLFLHADSILPLDADIIIADALQHNQWGRFDVTIQGAHPLLPMVARMMNLRSRITRIATGDQGIFMRRETFDAVGGFPPQQLMEDIEMCKQLNRVNKIGSPANVKQKVITSGRRWDKYGLWRTIWLMWRLRWQYFFGVSADQLSANYHAR